MRWRLPRIGSTTARFALLSLLILAVTSALVLAVAARLAAQAFDTELAEAAGEEARAIAAAFHRDGAAEAAALVRASLSGGHGELMLLEGPQGRALAGNAQGWPPTLPAPAAWRKLNLYGRGDVEPVRYGVVALQLDGRHRLLVGHSLAEQDRLLAGFRNAMLAALALGLLLSAAGAWTLSRFLDRRVRAAADAALAVAGGDLARRVPLGGGGDAFDSLAEALNVMLARIEALVGELRMVTDSLAHDLRSPLTRLGARIDRLVVERDPDRLRAGFASVAEEADALRRMLDVALEVSRAEAGIGRDRFAELDAAALVRDLADVYEPLIEDAGMALALDAPGPAPVAAHRDLLGRAIANLIDNALKHGGGTALRVSVRADAEGVEIAVADDGRGIAAGDRAVAVTRFARLDPARSEPGAGLGLSLAAATARLHGGELILADAGPGLRAALRLPRA